MFPPETTLSRRGLFAAAGSAAAAAALGPLTRAAFGQDCPIPTLGSVSGLSGSIARQPLQLVDAYSDFSGASFQGQLFACLSSVSGAGERYRRNQVVAGEQWLVITQISNRYDLQEATYVPGTFSIGVGTTDDTGTLRTASASFMSHGKACGQTSKNAESGTVTWTAADDQLVAGSFDLVFGRDRVRGTFSAPRIVLCEPRPATRTCLKA